MSLRIIGLYISLILFVSCDNDKTFVTLEHQPGRTFETNSKYWLHRANSIESILDSSFEYSGIEIDLHIIDNEVYVCHDYSVSECYLTLGMYIDSLNYYDLDLQIWLDAKNLSSSNFSVLDSVISNLTKYNLSSFIIESYTHSSLTNLYNLGYYTCYWVPQIGDNNPEEDVLKTINDNLNNCQVSALSGHYNVLTFLNESYPEFNKHIWTNGLSQQFMDSICSELSFQEKTKIVLVDFPNTCMMED